MKLPLAGLAAVGALVMLAALPVGAQTQATQPPTSQEPHVHPAPDPSAQATPGAESHDMHAMHMMMANMQASHAKLQGLVEKMNAAKGGARTDAIAALVTEMVQGQHAMREAMASHMAECPMMKMGNMQSMPNMPKPQPKP